MSPAPPTHAVILTPPGRSAVAVVQVAGPGAVAAVDAHFQAANGRPLADQPINAIRFGRWVSHAGGAGEELVVCRTDETTVEVHCHGGDAAVRAVVDALVRGGCVERNWREQVADESASAIEAEARVALAECVTDRAAAVLLDQLGGVLDDEVKRGIALIDDGDPAEAGTLVAELLRRAEFGLHLTAPWRVVIAGRPNVGKSRLINALVGYNRAIVFDQPGVTRDVVTATTAVSGWPVELADTAGLRQAGDELEAAGVELARRVIGAADLIVLVEAFQPDDPSGLSTDAVLADLGITLRPGQRGLHARNKIDLATGPVDLPAGVLPISAATGAGIERLVGAIGDALVPQPPPPEAPVPFTPRQRSALESARASLASGDADAARVHLLALLSAGVFTPADLSAK